MASKVGPMLQLSRRFSTSVVRRSQEWQQLGVPGSVYIFPNRLKLFIFQCDCFTLDNECWKIAPYKVTLLLVSTGNIFLLSLNVCVLHFCVNCWKCQARSYNEFTVLKFPFISPSSSTQSVMFTHSAIDLNTTMSKSRAVVSRFLVPTFSMVQW